MLICSCKCATYRLTLRHLTYKHMDSVGYMAIWTLNTLCVADYYSCQKAACATCGLEYHFQDSYEQYVHTATFSSHVGYNWFISYLFVTSLVDLSHFLVYVAELVYVSTELFHGYTCVLYFKVSSRYVTLIAACCWLWNVQFCMLWKLNFSSSTDRVT